MLPFAHDNESRRTSSDVRSLSTGPAKLDRCAPSRPITGYLRPARSWWVLRPNGRRRDSICVGKPWLRGYDPLLRVAVGDRWNWFISVGRGGIPWTAAGIRLEQRSRSAGLDVFASELRNSATIYFGSSTATARASSVTARVGVYFGWTRVGLGRHRWPRRRRDRLRARQVVGWYRRKTVES